VKKLLTVFLLSLSALTIDAQSAASSPKADAYRFKSAFLGMTLEQFQYFSKGRISVPFGQVDKHGKNVTVVRTVEAPLCSDKYNAPVFDGERPDPEEILCSMSWATGSDNGITVADQPVYKIVYRFWHSKLYQIDIAFNSVSYQSIADAFVVKYGPPSKLGSSKYQNVYGARWTGENRIWVNGAEDIAIAEGDGNGPGRSSSESMGIAILKDSTFGPPPLAPSKLDF
jgi:hypothetical protein